MQEVVHLHQERLDSETRATSQVRMFLLSRSKMCANHTGQSSDLIEIELDATYHSLLGSPGYMIMDDDMNKQSNVTVKKADLHRGRKPQRYPTVRLPFSTLR